MRAECHSGTTIQHSPQPPQVFPSRSTRSKESNRIKLQHEAICASNVLINQNMKYWNQNKRYKYLWLITMQIVSSLSYPSFYRVNKGKIFTAKNILFYITLAMNVCHQLLHKCCLVPLSKWYHHFMSTIHLVFIKFS